MDVTYFCREGTQRKWRYMKWSWMESEEDRLHHREECRHMEAVDRHFGVASEWRVVEGYWRENVWKLPKEV